MTYSSITEIETYFDEDANHFTDVARKNGLSPGQINDATMIDMIAAEPQKIRRMVTDSAEEYCRQKIMDGVIANLKLPPLKSNAPAADDVSADSTKSREMRRLLLELSRRYYDRRPDMPPELRSFISDALTCGDLTALRAPVGAMDRVLPPDDDIPF